jgi:hypothetical protein
MTPASRYALSASNPAVELLGLVAVALAARLPLMFGYEPATYADTGTYLQAARELMGGGLDPWQGRRTPGYPLLVAAMGGNPNLIVALQFLGGVSTSVLAYWLAVTLSGSRGFALAAGLAHALNLQQVFTEAALLTESISALSVIGSLALLLRVCRRLRAQEGRAWELVALGALCTYALFVRPQFICLLVVAPLAVTWAAGFGLPRHAWPRALGPAMLVLLPAVVLLAGWGAIQHARTGHFTLSTQSGFGLVNHTIDYLDDAPEEFAHVRDVLVRTRDRRIAEVGHARNTIWYAWPEIQQTTGWSLPEASRHLREMSQQVIREHPTRYAIGVASAWVDFWTVPFFWKPEQVQPPALRHAIESVWWVQHKLLRLANLGFVLLVAGVLVWPALRRRVRWDLALSAISATVLMSSLIQALADQGASSRYHLPTQSLVVLVLAVAAARAWASRRPPASPALVPGRA